MKHCTTDKCPQILDSSCVFYEGASLIFSGINTNDSVETVIQKLNLKLESFPIFNLNNYYTKNETNLLLENYYTKTETYSQTQIDNFVSNLELEIDNKANLSDVYLKTETYNQTEINGFLSGKQNTIGYTPENSANKSDSYTVSSSTTYASTRALVDGLTTKLDKGTYTGNAQDLKNSIDSKLNKPTTTSNTTSYPFVVGEDGNGNSARLPAGDLGKNFFNSDLSNTTARNHTMNAGVTVNTLGNPHTLSGLPNKNTDIANFRKVRVQNASGLDAVVDSKILHNDSVVSMTDAEKLTYRNNLKLSTENYSLSTPRIDFIAPFKLGKDISGIQYLSCIGSNLLLNLSDCEVKLVNTSTNTEYPVSVINTSANTTSQFSFGYNIASLPVGTYRVYVRNMLLTNIVDTTTFEVVNSIVKKDLSTLNWQKSVFDGVFTNSVANGTSVYRQPQSTSGETLNSSQFSVRKIAFLSDVFLNSTEANGNWQIEFSVNYSSQFWTNYSGGSRFGIVDGNVITTPTISADILYGQITSSASTFWRMFPSNIADTALAQTNGKYSIVKTGSIIRMYQIIAGVRIQIATHTITSTFGSLRFLFAANGNISLGYDMAITVNIDNVNI